MPTASQTLSTSTSRSNSETLMESETPSVSLSPSLSFSLTIAPTASVSPSPTSTPPQTDTLTASLSQKTASATESPLRSASPSTTSTCREYDDLSTDDTCEIFRPLPSEMASLLGIERRAAAAAAEAILNNASSGLDPILLQAMADYAQRTFHITGGTAPSSWIRRTRNDNGTTASGGSSGPGQTTSPPTSAIPSSLSPSPSPAASCINVNVPYEHWSGRRDSVHAVAVASIDGRIPLGALSHPTIGAAGGSADTVAAGSTAAPDDAISDNGDGGSPARKKTLSIAAVGIELVLLPITVTYDSVADSEAIVSGKGNVLPRPPADAVSAYLAMANATAAGNQTTTPQQQRLLLNSTGTFFTAVVTMRYGGPNTLNKVKYTMGGAAAWARCPVAMPGSFTVTLEQSDRLMPAALIETVAVGGNALQVGGAMFANPTAVVQLGIVTSLKEMSRCRPMLLDSQEEGDDDNYNDYKSGLLNPLELVFGSAADGRSYLRGAIVTSLAYAALLSFAMIGYSYASLNAASWFVTSNENNNQRNAQNNDGGKRGGADGGGSKGNGAASLTEVMIGYPSALVAVAAFAMDGAVGAGTILGVFGGTAVDYVLGWAAVLAVLAYIGHVLYVTTRGFPSDHLVLVEASAAPQHSSEYPAAVPDMDLALDLEGHGAGEGLAQEADDDDDLPLPRARGKRRKRAHGDACRPPRSSAASSFIGQIVASIGARLAPYFLATHHWALSSAAAVPLAEASAGEAPSLEEGLLSNVVSSDVAADPTLMIDGAMGAFGDSDGPLLLPVDSAASGVAAVSAANVAAAQRWLCLYDSYIAESKVRWYCPFELLCGALVTVLGSLAYEDTPFCLARGSLCVVVLGGQLLVMGLLRPPVQRWRWALLTCTMALQTIAAVLSTANAVLQDQFVELGMDCTGVGVLLFVSMCTAYDVYFLARAFVAQLRHVIALIRERLRRRRQLRRRGLEPAHEEVDHDLLFNMADTEVNLGDDEDMERLVESLSLEEKSPTRSPAPQPPLLSAEEQESAVIQEILDSFRDYLWLQRNESPS